MFLLHPSITQDLMVKYHQNGALVQELINGKLISGDWKEHPEFPGKDETGQKFGDFMVFSYGMYTV